MDVGVELAEFDFASCSQLMMCRRGNLEQPDVDRYGERQAV